MKAVGIALLLIATLPCYADCPAPPPPAPNTFADAYYVDADPNITATRTGDDWATAFATLQDALSFALPGQVIYVADGEYTSSAGSFALPEGVALYGSFEGYSGGTPTNTLRDPCPQEATSSSATHLSGGTGAPVLVVIDGSQSETAPTIIDGLWFTDHTSSTNGGAISATGSSLLSLGIGHCKFASNTASNGGAIYAALSGGSVIVQDSVFQFNKTSSLGQGGSCWLAADTVEVTGCSFAGTFGAEAGEGGGIWAEAASNIIVQDSEIYSMRAEGPDARGGGAFLRVPSSNGSIHFLNVDLPYKNAAIGGKGGGLFGEANEIIIANRIGGRCGKFFSQQGGTKTGGAAFLTSPTGAASPQVIVANYVFGGSSWADESGGAVFTDVPSVTMMNCEFTDNHATDGDGGAIYADGSGTLNIVNCTFDSNKAGDPGSMTSGDGGAIYASGRTPVLSNCIAWDNEGHDSGVPNLDKWINPTNATVQYSDVQGGWLGPGSTTDINTDPAFTNECQRQVTTNPSCIDAGDDALLPADLADVDDDGDVAETVPLDNRSCCCFGDAAGRRLRVYEQVDMGATEFRPEDVALCEWDYPTEMNEVSGIDVFDLLAYLDDWFALRCNADLDMDGIVDIFDQLAFLDCWFAETSG